MNSSALVALADPKAEGPKAADEQGRSAQNFLMEVFVRREEQTRLATASGVDIYAISAPLAVEGALRVVANQKACGGLSLSQLGEPRAFLSAIASAYPGFRSSLQTEPIR